MIIKESLITRLFLSSKSSGMYKIEHRIQYLPSIHTGVWINNVPTLMQNGQPYLWVDKTEPIYREGDKAPLLYAKVTYIYHQDIRDATVSDSLREGYDFYNNFIHDWYTEYDQAIFKNKRYGLSKLHKRPAPLYQALVIGLRPLVDSVELRHPLLKGVKYDPDLPYTFHEYLPAMDTNEELMNFLFTSTWY